MHIQNSETPNTWIIGICDKGDDQRNFKREGLSTSAQRVLAILDQRTELLFEEDLTIRHIPLSDDPLPFEGRMYGTVLIRVSDGERLQTTDELDLQSAMQRLARVKAAFRFFGFSWRESEHVAMFQRRT